jgi:hypothetical protein
MATKKPAAYIDGNDFVIAAEKAGLPTDTATLNKIVKLVTMAYQFLPLPVRLLVKRWQRVV